AASAAAVYALAYWVAAVLTGGRERTTPPSTGSVPEPAAANSPHPETPAYDAPHPFGALIAFAAGSIALIGLLAYPVGTLWLIAALTGYAALLWRYPAIWLFAVPALLPALDLSPWTGRLMLDEFDLL